MKNEQVDAIEIAKKQRHLYLLGRVKNNRPLSKRELDELAKLEKTKDKKSSIENRKSKIGNPDVCHTQREAAEFLGISIKTIQRYLKSGMPKTKDGGYDKTILKFFHAQRGKKPDKTRSRIDEADADYKSAKAQLTELELEIKQKKWRWGEDVDKRDVAKVLVIKSALLGLLRRLKQRLPAKIYKQCKKDFYDMINNFAK